MNKIRNILLLTTMMAAVSSIAFALPHDTPPISIPIPNGGLIKPGSFLQIPISAPGMQTQPAYALTCNIANPNYAKQYPIILMMNIYGSYSSKAVFTMNGQPLYLNGQGALNQPNNTVIVEPVWEAEGIEFWNYDNSDTATVTSCTAIPATNLAKV